jgi:DNA-binding CsgD family transcriptional regulator
MLDPEDSAFLIHLVAAAEAPQPDLTMLTLLAARLRADGGQMYRAGMCWSMGGSAPTVLPLPDLMAGLRLNRVYTGDELSANATGDQRALGLSMSDGSTAWLVLTRARTPFRAVDTARLTAYAPHLQQALHLSIRLAGVAAQEQVQALAARRMGVGLVQRSATGGRLQPDAVARDLLAGAGLSVLALARDWPQGAVTGGQIVTLAQGLDMLVLPAPQGVEQGQIGLLRSRDMPLASDAQFATALGITLAEARLARALAQGASLDDAALSLGLTRQTARFYSKQIFAKTGLSGQPALMRRIWTSALALAR